MAYQAFLKEYAKANPKSSPAERGAAWQEYKKQEGILTKREQTQARYRGQAEPEAGLSWAEFRSYYAQNVRKQDLEGAKAAWARYKSQHGIVTKPKKESPRRYFAGQGEPSTMEWREFQGYYSQKVHEEEDRRPTRAELKEAWERYKASHPESQPKRQSPRYNVSGEAQAGLGWPQFRSFYVQKYGKGASNQAIADAWAEYKETHGIKTKKEGGAGVPGQARRGRKAASPARAKSPARAASRSRSRSQSQSRSGSREGSRSGSRAGSRASSPGAGGRYPHYRKSPNGSRYM